MAGIYIHIPFCKQACTYCDFHFSTSLQNKKQMVEAIKTELQLRSLELRQPIKTIYFGGGTPSVLSDQDIVSILETVTSCYTVIDTPEITLEANPDDLGRERIISLSQTPINRLSIGIQSFFEADLKLMNRAHSAQEAKNALEVASMYFDNISVDLIYGIPGLSDENWMQNINLALSYKVPHISSYALTVEPHTVLAYQIQKKLVPSIDEEQSKRQFYILLDKLTSLDFVHYEISNFGRTGFFSENNTAYWKGKEYLGIGPAAHTYIGDIRSWNVANNNKYIKAIKDEVRPYDQERLTTNDRINEHLMTGLRTIWGVPLQKIQEEFGSNVVEEILNSAQKYLDQGLLILEDDGHHSTLNLKTTREGKFLCDGIASDLFILE